MAKGGLSKALQELYFPPMDKPVAVDVPAMNFVMVDGVGDPNTSKDFQEALGALYTVAYTMKFMFKKGSKERSHVVMPLEALWWKDDMEDFFKADKSTWQWTAMIMQPEFVTEDLYKKAREEAKRKKNPPGLEKLRFERFEEGISAQIMHIGPYSAERPNIEKVHKFIYDSGHKLRGKHHEIYLGDPRRAKPEKFKTVIRQPME
jgi:hypothetical protein